MSGTLVEHGEQASQVDRRRSKRSRTALEVAIVAGELVARILWRVLRCLIEDQLSLLRQRRHIAVSPP